ncbi:cobalt-precorrin-6A reductase [Dactylosporangium sp. NPDC000555]|uniref:cobalt-precorrin-6A reductase n=1 Tax=Dactylosporangium sp. NPDC000555 TaxID=3154260 RepID=UPI0033260B7F
MATVLLLGGTGEARRLASVLLPANRVISSLAGRVADPALPAGEVRVGGFGGAEGLAGYLRAERVDAVVDATHPFAARMSDNAARACAAAGVPLVVLRRPGFEARPGDDWRRVPSLEAAADLLPALAERVFLTTGRQGLSHFAHLESLWFLVRCVDPPVPPVPPRLEVVLDRGPFTVEGEIGLMRRHGIGVLVTKDSGGAMTAAKLEAARALEIPVVVVDRPPVTPGVPVLPSVEEVAARLPGLLTAPR